MKKIGYIVTIILQAAVLAGAWIVHYFTERRLGMVRYLNYKNMVWEREYPVEILKITGMITALLLTVFVFFLFLKKKGKASRLTIAMCIGMIVLTVLYTGYTIRWSDQEMTDYYFISILFLIAAIIQIVKTYIAVFLEKGIPKERQIEKEKTMDFH